MKISGTHLIASAMMLGTVASGVALADDAPKPAPGTLAGVLDASGITEAGYVAASYYHSNGYSTFHQFDVEHDTFQLDQAALTLAYQPKEGFGALVNIGAGEDMRILHGAEDGHDNSFDVIQGFVQYAAGPLTVIAGKYVTLAGAEVIAPTGNTQFSRSFLFFAEPLTHTGVRATYAVSDTLNVIFGVNNGWNTTSTSYGSKTGEFGIGWTPNKMFALTAQAYVGKVPAPYDGTKTLIDFVGTYNATDALTFVLSYDAGQQKTNGTLVAGAPTYKWNGVAAYANYAISDQWRNSLRVEYLDDKDAFQTGTKQTLKEATLTFGYDPVKSFELRFEARYDIGNKGTPTFVRTAAGAVANNQAGLALEGVYKF
ncbi:MAG: porin [Pseudomonadota bacterium]|nr:porin [Pseudomonadota bacterium]